MFESLVVDVLNRFLGDYVVDLDTSQLSLGIWQGNEAAAAPQPRCSDPGFDFSGLRASRALPPAASSQVT
jgi:hypothetical protein